jgi:hypothetical protein
MFLSEEKQLPNAEVELVVFLLHVWEVPDSDLSPVTLAILTEGFPGFPHSFEVNIRIVPEIRLWLFLSTSFPSYCMTLYSQSY